MGIARARPKPIFCLFWSFFLFHTLLGQSLRNETLSAMGTSSQSNGWMIQQSIGQSSVTGTHAREPIRISQGFLRGLHSTLRPEMEPPLGVLAYPNSFEENIRFRFTQEVQEAIQIQVYDLQGRLVYQGGQRPISREIYLSLPHLSAGAYLVQFRSGKKFIQSRIIKKP
jgi:Secretion system C-terminal sorting domain